MSAPDDYCELCDLPKSQCIHGQPPPPPAPVTKAAPKPRKKAASSSAAKVATKPVARRWTPPDVFKPLIVTLLQEAGGRLETEQVFAELETVTQDRLLPGDHETTPEGELRWRYAARRARQALIAEGVMTKDRPGVWALA
jgi:hypothetical protein